MESRGPSLLADSLRIFCPSSLTPLRDFVLPRWGDGHAALRDHGPKPLTREKRVVVGDSLPHAPCSRRAASACRSKSGFDAGTGRWPRPVPDAADAMGHLTGRRRSICMQPSAAVSRPTIPIQSEPGNPVNLQEKGCGESQGGGALATTVGVGRLDGRTGAASGIQSSPRFFDVKRILHR
jgi:hypothetical protein